MATITDPQFNDCLSPDANVAPTSNSKAVWFVPLHGLVILPWQMVHSVLRARSVSRDTVPEGSMKGHAQRIVWLTGCP